MSSAQPQTYLGETLAPDPGAVRFSSAKLQMVAIAGGIFGLIIVLRVMLHTAAATLPAR